MVFFEDGDIDTMLVDSPHSITIASVTAPCIFDDREEIALEQDGGGGQVVRVTVAQVKTSTFPNVKGDDPVQVNSIEYKVWRTLLQDDGAITELFLRKV